MANSCQQNNKLSPRKFSEKIALLNKKEAEGNAEFEEIIKEVQATKSQCTTLNNNRQQNTLIDRSQHDYGIINQVVYQQVENQHPDCQQINSQQHFDHTNCAGNIDTADEDIRVNYFDPHERLSNSNGQQQLEANELSTCIQRTINSRTIIHTPRQSQENAFSEITHNNDSSACRVIDSLSYNNNQDELGLWTEVPDIKICTFDDNENQMQIKENVCQEVFEAPVSEDGSLPDITSLQFYSTDGARVPNINFSAVEVPVTNSNSFSGTERNWTATAPPAVTSAYLKRDTQFGCSDLNVSNINSRTAGYAEDIPTAYLPRVVNNLLSNSECGFMNQRTHSKLVDYNNNNNNNNTNIMRSYSHNNIDYMTRRDPSSVHFNNNQQQQHQVLIDQHTYNNQFNQFCSLQTDQKLYQHRESNSSVRPQYGSTSPIESFSNLNSPQSETQNSPSSCNTEQGESYLPIQPNVTNIVSDDQQINFNQELIEDYNFEYSHGLGNELYFQNEDSNTSTSACDTVIPPFQEEHSLHSQVNYTQINDQQTNNSHFIVNDDQFTQPRHLNRDHLQGTSSTQIGHCQSPSSSRRLHNQASQGSYSHFANQKGFNGKS